MKLKLLKSIKRLKKFRLVEVFNVLFKLFQNGGTTEDKAFFSKIFFPMRTIFWYDERV